MSWNSDMGSDTSGDDAPPEAGRPRWSRGKKVVLAIVGLVLVGVIGTVVGTLAQPSSDAAGHDAGQAKAPAPKSSSSSPAPPTDQAAAERALATKPMVQFPQDAQRPHTLAKRTGKPISLPEAGQSQGRWIPGGFAHTPEGAVGQLKALDEAGISTSLSTYERAYRSVAQQGALPVRQSRMYRQMQRLHRNVGDTDMSRLSMSYEVDSAQVKGTVGDDYVVACVLGQATVEANQEAPEPGGSFEAGLGDCKAMRWVAGQWRIADGPEAAQAPSAWPGTSEAVRAGYRPLDQ